MGVYDRAWAGLQDLGVVHALAQIENNYPGVKPVIKDKTLLKFGRSEVAGTSPSTVQEQGGDETYRSSNDIDSIVSEAVGDTQVLRVEGHTVDGNGDFTFVVQNVTLTGQTPAALSTPLARCTRIANEGSSLLTDTAYVYVSTGATVTSGVPSPSSLIICQVGADDQQSQKASTTISKDDYYIITGGLVSVAQKSGSPIVTFRLQVRLKGGVFRTQVTATTSNAGALVIPLDPPVVVPANADVRIQAKSSTANTEVAAWMNGYLAINGAREVV